MWVCGGSAKQNVTSCYYLAKSPRIKSTSGAYVGSQTCAQYHHANMLGARNAGHNIMWPIGVPTKRTTTYDRSVCAVSTYNDSRTHTHTHTPWASLMPAETTTHMMRSAWGLANQHAVSRAIRSQDNHGMRIVRAWAKPTSTSCAGLGYKQCSPQHVTI